MKTAEDILISVERERVESMRQNVSLMIENENLRCEIRRLNDYIDDLASSNAELEELLEQSSRRL
ncbi:MAG: hypothetical protein FWC41_00475 [Firmicutes bacterium]|nr:hypothetical protein [Bacillota bacterium]